MWEGVYVGEELSADEFLGDSDCWGLGDGKIYNLEDGGRVRDIVLVFMFYFFTESLYILIISPSLLLH